MRHTKNLLLGMGAALVLGGFTGCASWNKDGERTAGRVVDDNRITERVEEGLASEPVFKFKSVDVKTFNGVVQLSGFVNSEEQKRRAGEIARNASGVVNVVNSLALKPEPLTPTGRTNSVDYPNVVTNDVTGRTYVTTNAPAGQR